MSFCVRVLSFITPLHCITQTEEPKKAKEELDIIMEKVLKEIGLTEEEYVSMFMKIEESCF